MILLVYVFLRPSPNLCSVPSGLSQTNGIVVCSRLAQKQKIWKDSRHELKTNKVFSPSSETSRDQSARTTFSAYSNLNVKPEG